MRESAVVKARIRAKVVDGPEDGGGLMVLAVPLATGLEGVVGCG